MNILYVMTSSVIYKSSVAAMSFTKLTLEGEN